MYVRVFVALISNLFLCARSQDLVMSVSVRRVHVVFSTAGFRGEEGNWRVRGTHYAATPAGAPMVLG